MATMASLQGANVQADLEAAETGVGVGEGKGLGVEGKDGVEEQFPVMLTTPLCVDIPPHELNVLKKMWGRGDIIIMGQPPYGVQMKRQDLQRLLSPGAGPAGWVNDVIMDFMGNLVNKVHSQRYVFHSYLRECFLLGPEKGRRALVRVVKKCGDAETMKLDCWKRLYPTSGISP